MKGLKRIIPVLLIGAAALSLAGCSFDFTQKGIAGTINNSVSLPNQYRITYEVESTDGAIRTVSKSKDSDGNIYFKSGDTELLFIAEGKNYVLYKNEKNGKFSAVDSNAVYNATYVNSATNEFTQYAEKSKEQFNPGMKSNGEQEMLSRTCRVYGVKIGTANTAVTYTLFVDKETGVCLGWKEEKQVAGHDLDADGEMFRCTEFITKEVPSLKTLIENS